MTKMIGLGLAIGVAGVLVGGCSTSEATRRAHLNKWCLSAMTEVIDCSYSTFEQCEASRRGVGGTCYANPRLMEATPAARRRSGR